MSNLKKVLSVGLASTMVMGMVATSAAAATYDKFADKDEIVNKDAVSMVTELGVIAGLPGGNYGPKQNIDRASFARLVCVALNGGQEPNLGNLKTTFTDTQGNWAEKYIAYCVQQGIIAGKGNNTFAPAANVTGSEAAKMLLVALGYNATYEKIGGATWQVTTDVLANQAGLYDGLEGMNTSEPLTRDNAAQMIYNTLNATKVKYEMVPGISANGQVTMTTQRVNVTKIEGSNTVDVTLLSDAFGVVTVEGVVVANEVADLDGSKGLKEGKTAVKVTNRGDGQNNYGKADDSKTEIFNVATGKDVLGKAITMYVKPSATAATSADKGTVIGSVVTSSSNNVVVDSGRGNLYDVADDNKLDLVDDETLISKNYGKAAVDNDLLDKDAAAGIRGEVRTLIDNDNDNKVDYVLYETYALGKVTSYSTKDDGSITLNGTKSLSKDDKADVVGFDDVKKGDYVLYAEIGGKLYVEKAESVTGELETYKPDGAKSTLTVDGTKYNASGLSFYTDGNKLVSAQGYNNLDKEATFYLDGQGNVIAVDGTAASNSYAFLIKAAEVGGVDTSIEVKVALDDGTTKVYTLDEDNSTGVTKDSKNLLCTYTLSDNEIALTTVSATDQAGASANITIEKGKASVTGISGAYADSSTVFFYVSPKGTYTPASHTIAADLTVDEVNVYVGKDKVADLTYANSDKTDFMYFVKDGDIKAVVVVTDSIGTSSNYIYLYKAQGTNNDGKLFDAIVDGEIKEGVTVTNSSANVGLYTYSLTTKGFYKVSNSTIGISGNVERVDGNSIIIGGVEYTLTDKTVIANIDGGDTALEAVINEGDYVTVKADTDKDLEAVFVTLPYDAKKTEITVNDTAATSAGVTIAISGDVITVGDSNKATLKGQTLAGILTVGTDAAVKITDTSNSNADLTADSSTDLAAGDKVIVTYTKDSMTLVDTYTIAIAQ